MKSEVISRKKRRSMKHLSIILIGIIFCSSTVLSACSMGSGSAQSSDYLPKTEFLLDTVCTVTVFSKNDEQAASDALALCADYEKLFSRTIEDSEISTINAAAGASVTVSPGTLDLLEKAIYYGDLSGGLFDVSIGAVSSMWNFTADNGNNTVPAEADILEALQSVDYRNIEIDSNQVSLKDAKMRLDMGGIAKGYIADRMADMLEEEGVKSAIIDLGGNIVTVGSKNDGQPWSVGIRDPLPEGAGPGKSIIGTITVEGRKSIGSSGTYERFFELDGVRYHHILDPGTGYPVRTDLAGVTIVSDVSVDGEGFSTFCILLGSEKAKDFLEKNNIQAVLVKEDGTVITTAGVLFTATGDA